MSDVGDEFNLVIDFDSLTLGEIDEIEERLEMSLAEVGQALSSGGTHVRMGKLLRVFALVKMRRTNPMVTWEDTANVRPPKATPRLPNPTLPPSAPTA